MVMELDVCNHAPSTSGAVLVYKLMILISETASCFPMQLQNRLHFWIQV